jgi:hypothetical protein
MVLLVNNIQTGSETVHSMFGDYPTFDKLCQLLFVVPSFNASDVFDTQPTLRGLLKYLQLRSASGIATTLTTIDNSGGSSSSSSSSSSSTGDVSSSSSTGRSLLSSGDDSSLVPAIPTGTGMTSVITLGATLDLHKKEIRFDVTMAASAHIASNSMGNALSSLIGSMESQLDIAGSTSTPGPLADIKNVAVKIMNAIDLSASISLDVSIGFSMAAMFADKRMPEAKDLFFRINDITADIAANVGPLSLSLDFGAIGVDLVNGVVNVSLGVKTNKPIQLTLDDVLHPPTLPTH